MTGALMRMDLSGLNISETVAWAALGLSFICLIVTLLFYLRLRGYRRQQDELFPDAGDRGKDVVQLLNQYISEVSALRGEVAGLSGQVSELRGILRNAVQRYSLVRHDAFEDIGGRQSFSAALLDDKGDGLVISSIHARSENRVYAKPVNSGESIYRLSDEESEAIAKALEGSPEAGA